MLLISCDTLMVEFTPLVQQRETVPGSIPLSAHSLDGVLQVLQHRRTGIMCHSTHKVDQNADV